MRLIVATLAALAFVAAPAAVASEEQPTSLEIQQELWCADCETTLADASAVSYTPEAIALIASRVDAGDTKSEIKDRLVAEYGTQILAAPPKKGFNLLAWLLPIVGVLGGALVLAVLAWRWSRVREPGLPVGVLDPALERRIDQELARFDEG